MGCERGVGWVWVGVEVVFKKCGIPRDGVWMGCGWGVDGVRAGVRVGMWVGVKSSFQKVRYSPLLSLLFSAKFVFATFSYRLY
jgi:hypothetical protein